jgi:transposase
MELKTLLSKYDLIQTELEELNVKEDSLLDEIPGVAQMLAVKVLEEILSLVSLRKWVSKVDYTHSRQII